jgi:hypothetical protein
LQPKINGAEAAGIGALTAFLDACSLLFNWKAPTALLERVKMVFTQMTRVQPILFSCRILPKAEDEVKLYWQCPDLELGH